MKTEYLSDDLCTAIEDQLKKFSWVQLDNAYKTLQKNYKNNATLKTKEEQLVYLATRMPETYVVLRHLFVKFSSSLTEVKTLLDLGAGPGTIAWAAEEQFPQLEKIKCVEQESFFVELAKELIKERKIFPKIDWIHQDITKASIESSHDLVVLSYVLNELSDTDQNTLIENAYKVASKYLLLIEPGTPQGYQNILRTRQKLIDRGVFVLGPCSHNKKCPLEERFQENKDWCHFSIRLQRPSFTQITKKGILPYEDEKFCYLFVSRLKNNQPNGRVIRPTYHKTGHTIIDLCQDGKIIRKIISKKDKEIYKHSKKIEWGDTWTVDDSDEDV